jgi:hypothetical protein
MANNFSETISLNGNGPYNFIINEKFAPFTLTVIPKDLSNFNKKVKAIEYIWGDGTSTFVDFKIQLLANQNLPFPTESGSPLNYQQTHEYYFNDLELSKYIVKINVYFFGKSEVSTFYINLNLKNSYLNSLENITDGEYYFQEIHLVKTKMFGPNNRMLYIFQTINPNALLMASLNWAKVYKENTLNNDSIKSFYEFKLPFEEYINTQNSLSAIPAIPYKYSQYNPDNGGNII